MPKTLIAMNTMARTSGIDSATTLPARTPRETKLTSSTMAMASHRASMNSSTACSTVAGCSATSVVSMPTGNSEVISAMACSMLCPRANTLPPSRMEMASPMASLPLTRNIGWGGSAGPRVTRAMSLKGMIRPPAMKLTARMSFSDWKAPLTRIRIFSSPVWTTPVGATAF